MLKEKIDNVALSIKVRIGYFVMFFFWVILAVILRDYGTPLWAKMPAIALQQCDDCMGKLVVFRVSFVVFVFHLICSLLLIRHTHDEADVRTKANDGYFIFKFLFQVVLFIATLFIPNVVFLGFGQFARFAAIPYIVIQVVYTVLLGYYWNQSWVAKERIKLLVGCTLSILVASLAMIIIEFVFYAGSGCQANQAIISVTLVICVLLTLASIKVEHGNLVTVALIVLFLSFTAWSAMQSEVDQSCNQLFGSSSTEGWLAAVALIFTCASLIWSAFSTANKGSDPFAAANGTSEGGDYSGVFFHAVFALAAAYVAMVLSSWQIGDTQAKLSADKGVISMWVKLATGMLTTVVYTWTLAAPTVCPNREFAFAQGLTAA